MAARDPARHNLAQHPQTVIFLGAGASKVDGAPIQSELFRGFFESCRDQRPDGPLREMERELATYFDRMWGIDVDQEDLSTVKFPTFEEALGLLELAESRGEFFRGFGGLNQNTTRGKELRNHLISLIAVYLEKKLRTSGNYHRVLVDRLRKQECLEQTAFISLNYDILIDNSLTMQGATGINYAVSFSNHDSLWRPRAIPLLKLHGSLNWLYCPTCNVLDLYEGEKIAAQLIDAPHRGVCDRCQELRVPIIIPPTFFKVMSNFYLQQIWKRAEEELKLASRIVFCGYSFPDADMHIKYLLKRAEVNRMGEAPEVFVVNRPNEQSAGDWGNTDERTRYMRFFRQKDKVHWTKLSFEQFAADPNLIEDQSKCM
jgi:hypothetical protein